MLRITLPQKNDVYNIFPIDQFPALDLQKTFHHGIDVYLKDASPYQNTYFSRYFEWQGMCRERFLCEKILPDVPFDGIFLTKCAHQEYVKETYAFQHIDIYLNTFQVKHCSLFLLFRFMLNDMLVSAGYQQIVCTGNDKQIRRLPEEILRRTKEYEISLAMPSIINRQHLQHQQSAQCAMALEIVNIVRNHTYGLLVNRVKIPLSEKFADKGLATV